MSSEALPILAGPTCTGKTHFAILLAERHGLEIVSADSRQIYRRLDARTDFWQDDQQTLEAAGGLSWWGAPGCTSGA